MQNLLDSYKSLDPLARGQLFRQIKDQQGVSFQEIARRLKKSPSYVVNSVRLLNLPVAIRDGLLGSLISEGHARALISIKDQRECVEVYKKVLRSHASVREVEELVRQKMKGEKKEFTEKQLAQLKKYLEKFFKEKFVGVKIKIKRKSFDLSALR